MLLRNQRQQYIHNVVRSIQKDFHIRMLFVLCRNVLIEDDVSQSRHWLIRKEKRVSFVELKFLQST